jgi:eukaryotic-like serine/threonine-protein kinase
MGEVYRARDTRLDRTVAVKVLPTHLSSNPDLKQRFEREARAISSLNHPHICHLYDIGSQNGTDFLVMEYLEGETLANRLQKGLLPLEQVLKIGMEIAQALDKAHRQGIVHRDLKPGNIMLTTSGAKLMDFGLAKTAAAVGALGTAAVPLTPSSPTVSIANLACQPSPLTQEGVVVGTFQYIAPEVLQGKECDARSDIFSLGCVLYEMTTGRPAFTGKSQLSVITAILEKDPDPLTASQPLAPPAFEYVVRTCLAKNPDERWQSAADVARDLQLVKSVAAAPSSAATKNRTSVYLLAAFCLLLAAVAIWLASRGTPPNVAPQQVGRFAFVAPVNSAVTDLAVSPDGRQIAFGNAGFLWVRSISSNAPRKLPGTSGAHQPFWSPDQRWLGFAVGTKLKKIALADGSVQDICDLPGNPSGMAWNQDQVILIGNYLGGLLRVSANGGEPVALPLNSARNENTQRGPLFLPDGHHFLFLSGSGGFAPTAANREIDIGDLSGAPPQRVLSANSNISYADGRLVYIENGVLLSQEFDTSSGSLKGDPAVLDTNVRYRAAFGYGSFSAGPGVLVYTHMQHNSLKWIGREGRDAGNVGLSGEVASVDVTPDGKSAIVEITNEKTGNGELWLVDLQRKVATRLTLDDGPWWNWDPIWSAGGKSVFFSSTRSDISDLYQRDVGSSSDRLLLHGGTDRLAPLDVSRDGRYLLYEVLRKTPSIWVLPLRGGKPFAYLSTKYAESGARFSPDGQWVSYVSNESGAYEVYVQSFPNARQAFRISADGGMDPRWRADGRELYFIAPDGRLMVSEVSTKGGFQASVPNPLFHIAPTMDSTIRRNYWPTPDGHSFLALQEPADMTAQVNVIVNWSEALKK